MKKHRFVKILLSILAVIIVFMLVINILPPEKNVETSPFVVGNGQLPLIAAHRGGSATIRGTRCSPSGRRLTPSVWTSSKAICT